MDFKMKCYAEIDVETNKLMPFLLRFQQKIRSERVIAESARQQREVEEAKLALERKTKATKKSSSKEKFRSEIHNRSSSYKDSNKRDQTFRQNIEKELSSEQEFSREKDVANADRGSIKDENKDDSVESPNKRKYSQTDFHKWLHLNREV